MSLMDGLIFAEAADKVVDQMVADNVEGKALFYKEGEETFVNSLFVANIYASLAFLGFQKGSLDQMELNNLSYLLAALDSRSRGNRLVDELKAKAEELGL